MSKSGLLAGNSVDKIFTSTGKFILNLTSSFGCRPQLRLGLQSLGLAQKDSLLLLTI
jgi:hypothetical protein